jgi:hypothetical protein
MWPDAFCGSAAAKLTPLLMLAALCEDNAGRTKLCVRDDVFSNHREGWRNRSNKRHGMSLQISRVGDAVFKQREGKLGIKRNLSSWQQPRTVYNDDQYDMERTRLMNIIRVQSARKARTPPECTGLDRRRYTK